MKKCLLVLLLLAAGVLWPSAHEKLEMAIQKKDWPALAALFADDSHQQAVAYFQECRRSEFSLAQKNKLMFYARFREFAEIGEITFAFENGAYRQLSLKRNVKPLDFVEAFNSYAISDRSIRMGNAEIHFKKGIIYQGLPMGSLFIFSGEWTFKVRPEDEEEQLTLLHLVRSETFEKDAQAGVFIYDPSEMLSGLPEPVPVSELPAISAVVR